MEHFPHVHFVARVLRQWSRKLAVIRMIVGANCISSHHQYLVEPRQPRPLICCTYIKIMNNNFPEEDAIGGQIGVKSDRTKTCFVALPSPFGPSHSLDRPPYIIRCQPALDLHATHFKDFNFQAPVCSGRCGDPSRAISWNCL